jgi:hypothetical protein
MTKKNKAKTQRNAGADSEGAHPVRTPLKLKKKICWREIMIFHTKYLKNFRASLGN